jgi:hypothetical protein
MLGMPFTVESPIELRSHLARLAEVYARAAAEAPAARAVSAASSRSTAVSTDET